MEEVQNDSVSGYRQSASLVELTKALAAFQAEGVVVVANATGQAGSRQFQYANLGAIAETLIPTLAKNGLAVMQPLWSQGGLRYLTTRISHTSGEWVEATVEVPGERTVKEFGAAVTLLRRYAFQSMVFVAPVEDVDDDSNDVPLRAGPRREPPRDRAPKRERASAPPPPPEEPPARPDPDLMPPSKLKALRMSAAKRAEFLGLDKADGELALRFAMSEIGINHAGRTMKETLLALPEDVFEDLMAGVVAWDPNANSTEDFVGTGSEEGDD